MLRHCSDGRHSRIADPKDENRIFEWLPEFVFDDKGNCAHYRYKKEDDAGFDRSFLHNRNRIEDGQMIYTNTYLEKVLYVNKTPYKNFDDPLPSEDDYLFSTLFDYGEYNPDAPYDLISEWDFRRDAFSDYKAGFEIRTTRLCKRMFLFHHFTGTDEYDGWVHSLNFEYTTNIEEDFTFLTSITSVGYIKKEDGSYSQKKLPPTEFAYQAHDWNREVKTISAENMAHAPFGLDEQQYQFTDLFNEGLSGILTEQSNGWYYKHNLGDGSFERAKLVSPKPSFAGLGSVMQLSDLDADGGKQLVNYGTEPTGFFELDNENGWQNFQSFKTLPNQNFGDPNARLLDLDGDGRPEVVLSEENIFTWYPSEGRNGFSQAQKTSKPFDEEAGPHIVFADAQQSIFLADMSGDGLTDIVRIKNGEVCFWPNLGYGRFGAKVALDNAPVFDHPDAFNPSYIRLADIDGSGTTDILYLGKNKFSCWKNLNGNRFGSIPFEMDSFPEIHNRSKITVTDLLGNGVACIVWSSPLAKDSNAPLKYIDLMNGKKPHIMISYHNNMGKEVTLEYTPSTKFYLDDKKAGTPWVTKLHFPVHCISKTITEDSISGYKFVSEYKYHHGYYDHPEREFRGFGMVEQWDAETFEHWKKGTASNIVEEPLHQEPVITKTWYHTGAFLGKDRILEQFKDDYWFVEMQRQGFSVVQHEAELPDTRLTVAPGMDTALLDRLSTHEWREALRACKGMTLRSEVFARDAVKFGNTTEAQKKELTPFSVATHNCFIELLQPKGKNEFAVFTVKESEAFTYSYERNPEDPRIAHTLNIKMDGYGNVLESAAILYPRVAPDTALPAETQDEQNKTTILYTQNRFTNDIILDGAYRLPLPSETKTFELKGVTKAENYYSPSDFTDILSDASSDTALYHELDKPPTASKAQRRLIEHTRSTYYDNDVTVALPVHRLESLALPFENYQLAYSPQLVTHIFGAKVDDALLVEGKFTHSEGDDNWWIRSGTIQYIQGSETDTAAQNRFYTPISYTDPYGAMTKVSYYGNYFLFVDETQDTLGNKAGVETFNFRTLSPQKMVDINGNFSEAISDELGLVKALAVMGKGNEADELTGLSAETNAAETTAVQNFINSPDSNQLTSRGKNLLQRATTRYVYDFEAFAKNGMPTVVASIHREEHFRKNNDSPVQIGFEYSNGLGEVVMQKVQAEPGKAKAVIVNDDGTIAIDEIDTSASNPKQLRWIGNGRTIKNNKGNAVKQYEPYFAVTHRYENLKELVETGVTPVMNYDAAGRLVKTEMPNGTFSKVEFDSWKQVVHDLNDTVLESDWYRKRTDATLPDFIVDSKEQQAAAKAAKHAHTPNVLYFDTLGRPVLSIEHNKSTAEADEFYRTKTKLDSEGNLRKVTDARENTVMEYKYDMLGNRVYQNSMDAGQRWLLANILGNPLRTWDERDHEFQYFYDIAHRPIHSKVLGGDGVTPLDNIFNKTIYGENLLLPGRTNEAALQAKNVLGKAIESFDTGGVIQTPEYDFKGHPMATTRKLFKKYKEVANWIDANLSSDLETENFMFTTETDALGRITAQTTPDGSTITPSYNEAGLLDSESVLHPNAGAAVQYIKGIDYNEKAQRESIIYGNDVSTKFHYNKETFRLKRIQTLPLGGGAGDGLQDLFYTYDAIGNITTIEDKAIPIRFFANAIIEPKSEFTYDALYRLMEATGRENDIALTFGNSDNWNDAPFLQSKNQGDPMAVRNYTQSYSYDRVGNILQMKHVAGSSNNWTRDYTYEGTNNRLKTTKIGTETYQYTHHPAHGFMEEMPHLEEMGWNFKEELVKTIRQKRTDGGIPETTYYQYDDNGQRIRKITENQATAGAIPTIKEERIYIGEYEHYKKHNGTDAGLERVSLSLMDAGHRFAMIETRNTIDDGTEKQLVRYQFHNHLGSAALELDATGRVISYEEYHPYGTTAYLAKNAAIKAVAKRYRYTGMERDEETGLEYHSARYYLPWLGRWSNTDPMGIEDALNLYGYSKNNPVKFTDENGKEARLIIDEQNHTITVSTTVHLYASTKAEEKRLRTIAQQAESFYQNPIVATDQEVSQAQAAGTAIPSRGTTFTDASGQVWTTGFDVHFQVHRGATPVKEVVTQTQGSTLYEVSSGRAQRDGLQVGDNTMSLISHRQKTIGGVVHNATLGTSTVSNATGELYYERGLPDAALRRRLIHEAGHFIGFDERYDPATASFARGGYSGFDTDFMGADDDSTSRTIAINPVHIEELGQFAMAVRSSAGALPTGTTSRTFLVSGHIDDTQGGRLHPRAQAYAQSQTAQRQSRAPAIITNTAAWTQSRSRTTPSLFPHIPAGFLSVLP